MSGTAQVSFNATDPGAGLYAATIQVDGGAVQTRLLETGQSTCHSLGSDSHGLEFLYLQPCPASLAVQVPLDTTALSNGVHHVRVEVEDAAGNTALVLDRDVTVANAQSSGGSEPGPSTANGSQAASAGPVEGSPTAPAPPPRPA